MSHATPDHGPPRRPWRLQASVSAAALAAAAATLQTPPVSAAASQGTTAVCGGVESDAQFRSEAHTLGHGHACAHLHIRAGNSPHVGLAGLGVAVDTQIRTAAVVAAAAASPAVVGGWSAARNPGTSTVGIAAVLLHTGDVLLLGDRLNGQGADTSGFLYDPVTGRGRDVSVPAPIFCGSLTPLGDGRILSAGGADSTPRGIPDLWIFDPVTAQWTQQPDMVDGRYYPTGTRMPDGRVVITAGKQADGEVHNPAVELFTPPNGTGALGRVAVVGEDHVTDFYPHQMVMPDGRLLQIDRSGAYVLDPADWSWRRWGTALQHFGSGSAHLVLPARPGGRRSVMVIGGLLRGTGRPTGQVLTYGSRAARWSRVDPMPTGRAHMNVVQVPDGSAYVIGGNGAGKREDPRRRTLHFDPGTGRWHSLATQASRRAYHSTALLLPDGRIMSAGDNAAGGGQALVDFYSPPYLFQGSRPRITLAPRQLAFGRRFAIRSRGPRATRAVLMAPGATTHANEMNARHVELAVRRSPRGLVATAPTPNEAPPGYYMLFVLDAGGVPSVARWVRIGR